MPVDNKKQELRSMLAGKSTAELEELLAMDFTETETAEPDVDYMTTILEVIEEREGQTEQYREETAAAWQDFKEYYRLRKQEELLETGVTEEPSHDHHRKTEQGQSTRRSHHALRFAAVAAAVVVVLCGTAFGRNIFRVIADWTVETFHFMTGQEQGESPEQDVFEHLRRTVASKTDTPAVPRWAPGNTVEDGKFNIIDRKDRCVVHMTYSAGGRAFTVQMIIHNTIPDEYTITYQKDSTIEEEYRAGGITHYIMGNRDNLCAMWINGCVEGYIQGNLTLEELQRMVDSIYEE